MLIVCTVGVKAVKIKKASRVAARGQHEHHSRPLWDGETGYIDISEGCAVDIMHRRLVALVDLGHKSAFDLLLKEAWNPEQAAMGNSTLPTVLDKLNIMSTIHLRKLIAALVREN